MRRTVDQPVLVGVTLFCFVKWRITILWWVAGFRNLFQIESASPGACSLSSVSRLSLRSSQPNCSLVANGVGRQAWCESAVVVWRGRKGEGAAVHLTTLAALPWIEIYPLNPRTNQGRDQSRKLETLDITAHMSTSSPGHWVTRNAVIIQHVSVLLLDWPQEVPDTAFLLGATGHRCKFSCNFKVRRMPG